MRKLIKVATKRIGRPTKPPKEGERVQLGLRVTPEMKKQLEEAAIRKGRSLSQEGLSLGWNAQLDVCRHLSIAQGRSSARPFFPQRERTGCAW